MSAITPPGLGPASPPLAAAAQVRSAQAAFFRAAVAQAAGPAKTAAPAEPAGAQPQSQQRLQRPGALLDIRI